MALDLTQLDTDPNIEADETGMPKVEKSLSFVA